MKIISMFLKLLSLARFEHAREHWVSQRTTSVAVVLLGLWFVYQLLFVIPSFSHAEVFVWASDPLNAIILLLFSLYAIYHAELGVQSYFLRFLRLMVVVISFASIGWMINSGGVVPV